MQHQIGVPVAVYILLVAAGQTSLLIHMRLSGAFKSHRGVIHRSGIKIISGQDGDSDAPPGRCRA